MTATARTFVGLEASLDPRHHLLTVLFDWTHQPYAWFKRKAAWDVSPLQLAGMPCGTLGQVLGTYLLDQGFELMPKMESHDVCHLLTGVSTDVPGEVALQFLLYGNGKRSLYLLGVLALGTVLFPELWGRWKAEMARGEQLERFFDQDFHALLPTPYEEVVAQLGGRTVQAA